MPKRVEEVSAIEVKRLAGVVGLHCVGGVPGLHLSVVASQSKTEGAPPIPSWILRIVIAGKRPDMGLGGYPAVTLAQAREKAREVREKVRSGVDPMEEARAARSALAASRAAALTFDQCAARYIDAHRKDWKNPKHIQQWENTLAQYASPIMGKLLVRDVDLSHVLAVLEPIWETKNETASRLRGRMEQVFEWAKVRGFRTGDNPATWKGNLKTLLAQPSKVKVVENFAALPYAQVASFMADLRKVDGVVARCVEFIVLTSVRSNTARGAVWSEIDLDARVWNVPANRMKRPRPHMVPLTDGVVEMLRNLPRVDGSPLVFPSPMKSKSGELSDQALTKLLRRMGISEEVATIHGFRSTFATWHVDVSRGGYPAELRELHLAHRVGDAVVEAYVRGSGLEKRRAMVRDWESYCNRPAMPAEVIELRRASGAT